MALSPSAKIQLENGLDIFLSLLGLLSVAISVFNFGFYLSQEMEFWVSLGLQVLVVGFVLQEAIRWSLTSHWREHLSSRWLENAIAFIMVISLLERHHFIRYFDIISGTWDVKDFFIAYLGLTQFIVFFAQLIRITRRSTAFSRIKMGPNRLFVISFIIPIALGTLLLKLPKATIEPISWLDAVFTATSSVCVTGLTVVDTGTRFTAFGQGIICFLFQLGGLGIMTLTMSLGILFSGGLGVKERILLGDLLTENRMGEVGSLLKRIIIFTFSVEAVGAVLLYFSKGFDFTNFNLPHFLRVTFHSISAFCNAGFSLYPSSLYDHEIRANPVYITIIMGLIVFGGLGFPVISNIYETLRSKFTDKVHERVLLRVHTKLVILSSSILLLGGMALIYLLEHSQSFAGLSSTEAAFQSLFLSVTTRTAGFNLWPTEALSVPTVGVMLFLMWIGGSPMSTAGGIKTLTFTVALLTTYSVVSGKRRVEILGRQIDTISILRSFAIIVGSLSIIACASIVIMAIESQHNTVDLVFEVFSAFGTVGLSRGVTPTLSPVSKVVVIFLMFAGRIGFITLISVFWGAGKERNVKLLKETIPIS